MNYRHAFHAGNFADLVKHAVLLQVLHDLRAGADLVSVIDTHAGRGLYDLRGSEAQRSAEAAAGIGQLVGEQQLPAPVAELREAVHGLNGGGEVHLYPGSPWLIAQGMRQGDRYLACELRPEEHAALVENLSGRSGVQTICADGYRAAWEQLPQRGAALVMIDPPFERADDYQQIVATLSRVALRNPAARAIIWLPLKDLETFDGFLRDADDAGLGDLVVVEARMRPLDDPMKMNGCALVLAGVPRRLEPAMGEIAQWVVQRLGQNGSARIWRTAKC